MSGLLLLFLLIAGGVVVALIWGMATYNTLLAARESGRMHLAQIDADLQKRNGLLERLVEVARAGLPQERESLQALLLARNQSETARQSAADSPGDATALIQLLVAEQTLRSALNRLRPRLENAPTPKSALSVQPQPGLASIFEELAAAESRISTARGEYNACTAAYNALRQSSAVLLLANSLGLREAPLFEMPAPVEQRPPVTRFSASA
jgi:LemA protein